MSPVSEKKKILSKINPSNQCKAHCCGLYISGLPYPSLFLKLTLTAEAFVYRPFFWITVQREASVLSPIVRYQDE
jgi:hypothetical protein